MSWQACPVCHGKGTVAASFYGGKGKTRPECRSCHGKGILLDPVGYVPPKPYKPYRPDPWGWGRYPWSEPYRITYTSTTSGTGATLLNGSS